MLRRLRHRVVRFPRVIAALAVMACAAPAVAGPLAFCLNSGDSPRVVPATDHCESMAESAVDAGSAAEAPATTAVPAHLPAVDEAVGTGAGAVVVPPVVQTALIFTHVGGLLPPLPDLLPSRDDAYGGAAPERSSMRSLAGAVVGRSVRLRV